MPESDKHLQLVSCIVAYIRETYTGVNYVVSLCDLPGTATENKPPKIGEFRPDVYAIDAPLTRTIVGEAKIEADLDTEHTQKQIRAFMTYLRQQPNPVFILAVPWSAKARGHNILGFAAKEISAPNIKLVVVDEVAKSGH